MRIDASGAELPADDSAVVTQKSTWNFLHFPVAVAWAEFALSPDPFSAETTK